MSKSNTTENDVIQFMFNAVAMPAYGANLYVSLHTGDPGEAGVQNTNEAAYTGYARVLVTRDAAGFTVSGNEVSNTGEVTFPECSAGSEAINYVAVGIAASGATQILYSGALTGVLNVSALITPRFPAGTLIVSED